MSRSSAPIGWLRRTALASAAALAVAGLAACGSSDDSGSGSSEADSIKVALQPTSFAAPYFVAQEQGFFEDAGLDVTAETLPNAGGQVPLIASGDAQFAVAPLVPIIVARSQGLPLEMVAPSSLFGTDEDSAAVSIVAPEGVGISSAKDLEGRPMAVIGLKAAPEQLLRKAVELDGGDPETIKMTQMDYPTGFSALAKGDVEAMIVTQPFTTQAITDGYKVISYPDVETDPGGLFAAWFASSEYLGENADAAEKFVEAIEKANEWATAHPDEVNAIVARETGMDKAAQEVLPPVSYGTEIDVDSVSGQIEDVDSFGWARNVPSSDELIWKN